ncbi:alpha/beta hydrolase [uncultured Zhongshania sp.]|uniref:alpha/beta fold hydrolase n=1 Tax=uncultured Zhongshania sp. TaxID=1642288 RepID=UPI0030DD7CD5|tara:strand:- start:1819 stop:2835 length:1017 start_codon:yes stop_codon:yes gene_type:complete
MFKLKIIGLIWCVFLTQATILQAEESRPALVYDAELSAYDYDFTVNYFAVKSQQQSLKMAFIYLKGDADKPVVTLLHGKNFNADYWSETALFLQGMGYGVVIPDQIGFGKSSKPINYQYSFAAMAQQTHSLLSFLEIEKSIVIGHSMGGMLASRFALMYPQVTQQLVLLNPIGLENYLQYVEYKDTDFFYKGELAKTEEGIKNYQRKNYYDGKWNDQYAALTDFMIGQLNGPDKDLVAWVNAKTYDMIFTQPVVAEFKDLSVPVSLIIGSRDRTGPGRNWMRGNVDYELGRYDRLGKKVAKIIPNASLFELPSLGHLPHIEDFEQFKKVLLKAFKSGQ